MSKIKVAVAGASGRMGKMLIEAIMARGDMVLHGALAMFCALALSALPN